MPSRTVSANVLRTRQFFDKKQVSFQNKSQKQFRKSQNYRPLNGNQDIRKSIRKNRQEKTSWIPQIPIFKRIIKPARTSKKNEGVCTCDIIYDGNVFFYDNMRVVFQRETTRIQEENDSTLLIRSIFNGDFQMALGLLESGGVDLSIQTQIGGNTALSLACRKGLKEISLKILASGNAYASVPDNEGNTPLMYACDRGLPEVALAIIATKNGNISAFNKKGETALILACRKNLSDVALAIIKTGEGNLSKVCQAQKTDTLYYLSTPEYVGTTALLSAILSKMEEVVYEILRSDDCNINYINHDGSAALDLAKKHNLSDSIIGEIFEKTTEPNIIIRYLVSTTTGRTLIRDSIEMQEAVKALKFRALLPENICKICDGFSDESYIHKECGAIFHKRCISHSVTHMYGEILSVEKTKCPQCRQSLDLSSILPYKSSAGKLVGRIISEWEILALDKNFLHKMCKACHKVFPAGEKKCEINQNSFSDYCSKCQPRIFSCPKCNMQLEHLSGCPSMACCSYGWHGCKGASCDHGSNSFTKFCGERWEISMDQRSPEVSQDRFTFEGMFNFNFGMERLLENIRNF